MTGQSTMMIEKIDQAKLKGYHSIATDFKLKSETILELKKMKYTVEEFSDFEIISWEYEK